MLDLAILGLLEERDLHGYEIRRQLREHLGLLANVSFGSIYPALTRLEKSGAVVATEGATAAGSTAGHRPPRRPARSSGELAVLRARRALPHPGPAGQEGVPDHRRRPARSSPSCWPGSAAADDARSFGLRLAFARHLAPQARLTLLERRRALLVQRLGRSRGRPHRPRRLRPLGRAAHRRRRGPRHQLARPPSSRPNAPPSLPAGTEPVA